MTDFRPNAREQELEKHLSGKYFLLSRTGVIGSALATLVAAGFISYTAAKQAVTSSAEHTTAQELEVLLANARSDSAKIGELRKEAENGFAGRIRVVHIDKTRKADDRNIQAPAGTTRDDWDVLVIPEELGLDEPGSESDNALIKVEARAEPIAGTVDSWHIVAMFRYREATTVSNAPRYNPGADVLLIRKAAGEKVVGAQR